MASLDNHMSAEKIAAILRILSCTSLESGSIFRPEEIEMMRKVAKEYFSTKEAPPVQFSRSLLLDAVEKLAIFHLAGSEDLLVGEGGKKTVHYGVDILTGQSFAVAAIPKTAERERTIHECTIMASLRKVSNVVHLYGIVPTNDSDYLLMEPFSSDNLESRRFNTSAAPLSINEKFLIARDCIEALYDIHRLGIAHCDIKPDNILLKVCPKTGNVIKAALGDFGSATHINDKERVHTMQITAGPCAYRSPDKYWFLDLSEAGQGLAKKMWEDFMQPGDVWSMGIVLLELFRGENFIDENPNAEYSNQVLSLTQQEMYGWTRPLPWNMQRLLNQMLKIDPEERWTSEQLKKVADEIFSS
jgi:serine/threonine protein kinase